MNRLGTRFLKFIFCLGIAVSLGAVSSPSVAKAPPPHRAILSSLLDSPGTLAPDKGKFRDVVNGRKVGEEQFEISSDGDGWVARGAVEIKNATGPDTHITSLLRLNADGTPLHYEWTTSGPKNASSTIDFDKGTATIHLRVAGAKPFTQQYYFKTPRVAVLDDNLYHQYTILASLYDWSKKGPQEIPVLIPQEMTPGTVTLEDLGSEEIGGKNLEHLQVRSQDLEINLYFDGDRLDRIVVPSSNAEIIRE